MLNPPNGPGPVRAAAVTLGWWALAMFLLSTVFVVLELISAFAEDTFVLSIWIWMGLWLVPSGLAIAWIVVFYHYKNRLRDLGIAFCREYPRNAPSQSFMRVYLWLCLSYRSAVWFYVFRWWLFELLALLAQFDSLSTQKILVVGAISYFVELIYFIAIWAEYLSPPPIRVSEHGHYELVAPVFGLSVPVKWRRVVPEPPSRRLDTVTSATETHPVPLARAQSQARNRRRGRRGRDIQM